MKSKKEILNPITLSYWESHQYKNALHEEGEYVALEDADQAMEQFAAQEAVDFAEWLLKNYSSSEAWKDQVFHSPLTDSTICLTTEEVFAIYKQLKNK